MAIKTAFVLIEQDNKILLTQEGIGRSRGRWGLPGGHVDKGESPQQAAIREAEEESGGLEIKLEGIFAVKTIDNLQYQGREEEDGLNIEVNIFKAKSIGGNIYKNKLTEQLDVQWFTREEIKQLPLRWEWLKELI